MQHPHTAPPATSMHHGHVFNFGGHVDPGAHRLVESLLGLPPTPPPAPLLRIAEPTPMDTDAYFLDDNDLIDSYPQPLITSCAQPPLDDDLAGNYFVEDEDHPMMLKLEDFHDEQ
jgi:hypothetical protein